MPQVAEASEWQLKATPSRASEIWDSHRHITYTFVVKIWSDSKKLPFTAGLDRRRLELNYRRLLTAIIVGFSILAMVLPASAGQPRFERTGARTQRVIGLGGGEVSLRDVTLMIPAGALAQDTVITIDAERATLNHDRKIVRGDVYEFGPSGLRFRKPAQMRLSYVHTKEKLPHGLGIYRFSDERESWERLNDSMYDPESRILTASIGHFSTYAAGTAATEFSEPFGPSRSYFKNNDEIVSPQTGCLRIVRRQFSVPGRGGLGLSMSDYLSPDEDLREPTPMIPELEYVSTYDPSMTEYTPFTSSDNTKLTWNGGRYDVVWEGATSTPQGRRRSGSIHSAGVNLAIEVEESAQLGYYTPHGSASVCTADGTRYVFSDGKHLSSITDKTGNTSISCAVIESPDLRITLTDCLSRVITVARSHVDYLSTTTTLTSPPQSRSFQTATTISDVTQYRDPAGRVTKYVYDDYQKPQQLTVEYPTGGKTVYTFGDLLSSGREPGVGYYRHVVTARRRYLSKSDTTPISSTTYQYTLNATYPYTYWDSIEEAYFDAPTVYDVKTCLTNDGITKTRFVYNPPLRHGWRRGDNVPMYKVPGPSEVTVWEANVSDGQLEMAPFLEKTVNEYDDHGNLTKRTVYCSGNLVTPVSVEEWAYDNWGNVVYEKDAVGHETYSAYLNTDLSQFSTNSHGFTNAFYDGNSVQTSVHNALAGRAESRGLGQPNAETYLLYDSVAGVPTGALKQKKELHRGNWAFTNYTSDQYGNITSTTDPDGYTASYTYGPEYQNAYLTRESMTVSGLWLAGGETTADVASSYTYSLISGDRTEVTDPNGRITGYTYDAIGRLKQVTLPAVSGVAALRTATYDDSTSTITATDENGVPTKFYYDGLGRLSKVELFKRDTLGVFSAVTSVKTLAYDSRDRVITETLRSDGKLYSTSFVYDSQGRLTKTTFPDGSFTDADYEYNYDDSRGTTATLVKRFWDENGQPKEFGYDAAGRLIWVKEYPVKGDSSSSQLIKTTYEFDELDRLLQVTDGNTPARITQYTYDELGHLRTTTFPDGSTSTNECRASGDIAFRTDRQGQSTSLTYDEAHRLRMTLDQGGNTILQYWYDKAGNRVRAESHGVITTQTYDERNRLTFALRTIGGRSYPLTLGYDSAGNRNSFTGPDSVGRILTYDERNRVTSVNGFTINGTAKIQAFEYCDSGPLKKVTFANGILANYTLDGRLRPAEVRFSGGSPLVLAYGYDNVGNVVLCDGVTYQYDGLNRLEKGF